VHADQRDPARAGLAGTEGRHAAAPKGAGLLGLLGL
jgi:hypothetical protein